MLVLQSMDMSPEEETDVVLEKPKRAPRKRVAKVISDDAPKKAPVKRVAKRVAVKKKVAKEEVSEPERVSKETSSKRKAPTPIADSVAGKKKSRKQLIVIATMIVIGVGASAIVGFTDKGQIDVEGTIAWRNEQAKSAGRETEVIPVQNTPQLPDGGLIGMGIGGPIDGSASSTPPAPTTASSTASTTEPVGQAPLTNAEAEAAAQAEAPETPAQ